MDSLKTASRRERQRASTIEEIKATARQLMATEGTAAISLRAIAGRMGIVPSALYRYYPSRDDLLTALLVDAFGSMGDAIEQVYHESQGQPAYQRMVNLALTYRDWATQKPVDFQLTYGSPVPDYHAPPEETGPAAYRTFVPLLKVIAEGQATGQVELQQRPTQEMLRQLGGGEYEDIASPEVVYTALTFWGQVHGLVILEHFGHLHAFGDIDRLFVEQVGDLLRRLGWQVT